MQTHFTPFPWKTMAETTDDKGYSYIAIGATDLGGAIAFVYTDGCGVDSVEQAANAQLMVKSPELFAKLAEFHRYHTDPKWAAERNGAAAESSKGEINYLDVILHEAQELLKSCLL